MWQGVVAVAGVALGYLWAVEMPDLILRLWK